MTRKCVLLLLVLLLSAFCFAALADGMWYCPNCGRLNDNNYCPFDGTPRSASVSAPTTYTIVTTDYANIRSGPASYYSLLGQVSKNTPLTAYGRVSSQEGGLDWYMIQYNGQTAYVSVLYAAVSGQPTHGESYTIVDYRTNVNYSNYSHIQCTLNAKLATRTGPGTTYDEPGSFLSAGKTVTVLSKAYDKNNEIWWVQVEFSENGKTYWAYTGVKRIDGLNLSNVPEEIVIGTCTTTSSTSGSYCPNDQKKTADQKAIPAGASCKIYGYVDGDSGDYILIEFYDTNLKCNRRTWVKDWSVENYTMYYGF